MRSAGATYATSGKTKRRAMLKSTPLLPRRSRDEHRSPKPDDRARIHALLRKREMQWSVAADELDRCAVSLRIVRLAIAVPRRLHHRIQGQMVRGTAAMKKLSMSDKVWLAVPVLAAIAYLIA